MVKQILLSVSFGLLLISIAKAGGEQQSNKTVINNHIDTIGAKDSLPSADSNKLIELKYGFKDLFINSSLDDGIMIEQLNPKAINFVDDYIQKHGNILEEMKDWGRPYFDMMDAILIQHGLPRELKYLAVIESHLKSNAVSWAGAVGPWQFMPATGKRFGLKVSHRFDERTDYFKSTHAAASYLTELFSIYGDWLLVVAAYNSGPGNVNIAIRKSKSKDFWTLQNFLPTESKNHVKKFIATHFIMEGRGGITTITKNEMKNILLDGNNNTLLTKEQLSNTKIHSITGRYNSLVVTKFLSMDILTFNQMNPDFDKLIASNGKYELRLPNEKMELFIVKKSDIQNESIQLLLNSANYPGNLPGKSNR